MRIGLIRSGAVFLAVVAAMVVSAQRAAPQGAAAPMLDIAGFRPGMGLREAYNALKAYNPKVPPQAGEVVVPEISDKKLPYALLLPEGPTPGVGEKIQLEIALPPNQQVVWRVSRDMNFSRGSEPTVASLAAALRQKYGQENPPEAQTIGNFSWIFDQRGQLATPGSPLFNCWRFSSGPYGPGNLPNLNPPRYDPNAPPPLLQKLLPPAFAPCRSAIAVHAFIGTGADPRLAGVMRVSLTDLGLESRTWQATYEQIAKVQGQQDKQNIEKAQQRPVPKL